MLKSHRVLALLLLQGCSLLTDFDRFGVGHSDVDAGEDAGNRAGDAWLLPGEVPGDAGEIAEAGPGDAGLLPSETPGDAGEIVDAGHNPSPPDAGALPPLGPYTTADLPEAAWQINEFCGSVSLFQTRWPQEELGDPSCPEWLTQTGVFELMRESGNGDGDPQCSWRGDPEGVVFSAGGITTERTVFVGWATRNQLRNLTVVWRGLLCTYKAGDEL